MELTSFMIDSDIEVDVILMDEGARVNETRES